MTRSPAFAKPSTFLPFSSTFPAPSLATSPRGSGLSPCPRRAAPRRCNPHPKPAVTRLQGRRSWQPRISIQSFLFTLYFWKRRWNLNPPLVCSCVPRRRTAPPPPPARSPHPRRTPLSDLSTRTFPFRGGSAPEIVKISENRHLQPRGSRPFRLLPRLRGGFGRLVRERSTTRKMEGDGYNTLPSRLVMS